MGPGASGVGHGDGAVGGAAVGHGVEAAVGSAAGDDIGLGVGAAVGSAAGDEPNAGVEGGTIAPPGPLRSPNTGSPVAVSSGPVGFSSVLTRWDCPYAFSAPERSAAR